MGASRSSRVLQRSRLTRDRVVAHDLLDALHAIERRLGRTAGERWGPRVIDLDLLLYDDLTIADERLRVPHERLAERAFVLVPLAELDDRFAAMRDALPPSELAGVIRVEREGGSVTSPEISSAISRRVRSLANSPVAATRCAFASNAEATRSSWPDGGSTSIEPVVRTIEQLPARRRFGWIRSRPIWSGYLISAGRHRPKAKRSTATESWHTLKHSEFERRFIVWARGVSCVLRPRMARRSNTGSRFFRSRKRKEAGQFSKKF